MSDVSEARRNLLACLPAPYRHNGYVLVRLRDLEAAIRDEQARLTAGGHHMGESTNA